MYEWRYTTTCWKCCDHGCSTAALLDDRDQIFLLLPAFPFGLPTVLYLYPFFNLLGRLEVSHQPPNLLFWLPMPETCLNVPGVTCTADFWTCYFHSHSGNSWKEKCSVSGFISSENTLGCVFLTIPSSLSGARGDVRLLHGRSRAPARTS